MPLIKSKSNKAVGKNIAKEEAAGKPKKQAEAIALNTQRKAGGGKKWPKGDRSTSDGHMVVGKKNKKW